MKSIPVEKAVGMALCHDITEIRPNECKRVAFSRGHIIQQEDVAYLLRLGKENIYIWEETSGLVHEDDAALRIAKAISRQYIKYNTPKEGRINFYATKQGLFKINIPLLNKLNSIPDITIATAHSMQEVKENRQLAGTRVIPLAVNESSLQALEECCKNTEPLLEIIPFKSYKVGLVITGSEVFSGRIKDGFSPILEEKFKNWQCQIHSKTLAPDKTGLTTKAINEALEKGADFIAVTGGMSVDPDDKTPAAIKIIADEVITYGAPVFPGAMFMLAYKGNIPIVGLPGCVMYNKASIFDLVMPRILAGIRLTKYDILQFAHGGLCESCKECHYPVCSFGKGI